MISKTNLNSLDNQHLFVIFDIVLPEITRAKIKYWVFGGVSIAGLAGTFVRENQDLDIYILNEDFDAIKKILTDLCLSAKDNWKLIHSVLPNNNRWKLELLIGGEERFSVIPIYRTENWVEFRYNTTINLSNQALIQESRSVDGLAFFSPPIIILQKLFIFKAEQYLSQRKKYKSLNENKKYLIDSKVLFSVEENEELNLKFQEIYDKVPPLQTLEDYINNHRPSGWGLTIKMARLFELKLRGFTNPEYVFGLINYLEDKGKPKINFYQKVRSVKKYLIYSDLIIQEIAKNKLFVLFEQYYKNPRIVDFIIKYHSEVSSLPKTKTDACFKIFSIIDDSNIGDLKLFKNPLLLQLLLSDNPLANYKNIENIFINQNTSLIEKVVKTFEVFYNLSELKIDYRQFKPSIDDQSSYDLVFKARQKSNNQEAVLNLETSDALKEFNLDNIKNIFRVGVLAPELLGENLSLNSIPFAVSLTTIKPWDLETTIADVIKSYDLQNYGEIIIVIKNYKQYKLVNSGGHVGIMFGLPLSGVKFIIVRDKLLQSKSKDLEELFLEITQNAYYLPVVDESGNVIFTPEMYNYYRSFFAGVNRFNGSKLLFEPIDLNSKSYPLISKISGEIAKNKVSVYEIFTKIDYAIKTALKKSEVVLKTDTQEYNDSELLHIGSTGRETNTLADFDFDFSIKLKFKDFARIEKIVENIKNSFVFKKYYFYQETEEFYQLRIKGITMIGNKKITPPVNIDVSLFNRLTVDEYGTNEAIIDKLDYIKNNYGQSSYEIVLANIILAKQILKDNFAYKRGKQGGFGGGGLENFILANGGNIERAFNSFRSAAYENGKRISYEDFSKKYYLWDAGLNNKYNKHDNFIYVLKPNGYQAILDIIENYFSDIKM